MRPMIYFACSMLAVLTTLLYQLSFPVLLILGAIGIAGLIYLVCAADPTKRWLLIALVIGGSLAGSGVYGAYSHEYREIAALCDQKTHDISATVIQSSLQNGTYQYLLKTQTISVGENIQKKSIKILIRSPKELEISLFDSLQIKGQFKLFEKAEEPGEFDEQNYYKSKKIYLYLSGDKIIYTKEGQNVPNFWGLIPYAIREKIDEASNFLQGENGPLMVSLLTSDKTELDRSIKNNFSKAGLSHVIAVSGMHISILIGTVGTVISLFGGSTLLRGLISIILIFIYMAVGEFSPSIMRSGFVYFIAFGGDVAQRDYDKYSALLTSAVLIMLGNPFALYQVGFWLSYLSVTGILLLQPVMQKWIKRIAIRPKWLNTAAYYLLSVASTTVSATIFTIPVLLMTFGQFSFLGPVANMLVLPIVPYAFIGAILLVISSLFSGLVAQGIAFVINPLFFWITLVAEQTARLGGALGGVDKTYYIGGVIYVCCVAAFLFTLGKKEERVKNLKTGFLCLAAVFVGLSLMAWFSYFSNQFHTEFPADAQMKISFIDVGQGSASFLQTHELNILIDCGTTTKEKDAAQITADYIKRCGQNRIDYMGITHYHEDHVSGILQLMKRFEVKNLILPDLEESSGIKEALLAYARKNNINILLVQENQRVELPGEANLQMIVFGEGKSADDNTNEEGIVYRFGKGDRHVLFTGDIEEEDQLIMAREVSLQSDILTIPHHGANNAAAYLFLKEVKGQFGVISVAENNPYGHPGETTLKKLEETKVKAYETDSSGIISMILYKDKVTVWTQKQGESQ